MTWVTAVCTWQGGVYEYLQRPSHMAHCCYWSVAGWLAGMGGANCCVHCFCIQMKSVGEVMAIGRTWQESLQKALRGMESGLDGWSLPKSWKHLPKDQLMYKLRVPNPDRIVIMKQVGFLLCRCCCGV